jgi:hypothetical protein
MHLICIFGEFENLGSIEDFGSTQEGMRTRRSTILAAQEKFKLTHEQILDIALYAGNPVVELQKLSALNKDLHIVVDEIWSRNMVPPLIKVHADEVQEKLRCNARRESVVKKRIKLLETKTHKSCEDLGVGEECTTCTTVTVAPRFIPSFKCEACSKHITGTVWNCKTCKTYNIHVEAVKEGGKAFKVYDWEQCYECNRVMCLKCGEFCECGRCDDCH